MRREKRNPCGCSRKRERACARFAIVRGGGGGGDGSDGDDDGKRRAVVLTCVRKLDRERAMTALLTPTDIASGYFRAFVCFVQFVFGDDAPSSETRHFWRHRNR